MQDLGPFLKLAAALGLVGMTIALLGIAAVILSPSVGLSALIDSVTLLVVGGLMVVPYKVDISANKTYRVGYLSAAAAVLVAALIF